VIAAAVCGAAPLIYASLGLRAADDSRVFWMAAIATLFMGGLLSAAFGISLAFSTVFVAWARPTP
jgi:hypothetical protein